MDSPVQKIKERLGIEEVASTYIKLERAGANLKARCPFHNEKTPSFFLSPDRGTYYCFGCGASGDIFTFVEEFEGLDFKGALKMLAERAGVELPRYSKEDKESKSERERLFEVMEAATKFFENNLAKNVSALEYLKQRGLTDATIKEFRIGFAVLDWRTLYDHLRAKSFTDMEIERAGLAKRPEDTQKAMYDRFRGRVMFPLSDSSGRVIAFSGRIFEDDGKSAKYLNSPETPIFSKNAVLYGIHKAKDAIRRNNFSILVEGQMDLVMSHQASYRNTVATSGTALSDAEFSRENIVSNLGLVRRLSQNIVLAFDGDEAGEKAALRAGKIALSLGMDVKVADIPADSDPADLIQKNGADSWREAVKKSTHIVEFAARRILQKNEKDSRKAGREINEKVLPLIAALPSSVEQAHFLKKISDLSGTKETALQDDFKKAEIAERGARAEVVATEAKLDNIRRQDYIKRKLLGIALWQRGLPDKAVDLAKLTGELERICGGTESDILRGVGVAPEDLIFEAEIFYQDVELLRRDVQELLLNLEEEILKEDLAVKMRELYRAEEEKDNSKAAEIFKECQILNNKLQEIKNNRIKVESKIN